MDTLVDDDCSNSINYLQGKPYYGYSKDQTKAILYLTREAVEFLYKASSNPHCTSLLLQQMDITFMDYKLAVAQRVTRCDKTFYVCHWEQIELNDCSGVYLKEFVEHILHHMLRLKQFTFRDGTWEVENFIGIRCNLERLILEDCYFPPTSNSFQVLAKGLNENCSIQVLSLARCELDDNAIACIVKNVPMTLQVLDLSGNYSRSTGVKEIGNLLLRTHADFCLQTINLSNQRPGERGGSLDLSLLEVPLLHNVTLRHLDLSSNMLFYSDIHCLFTSLQHNPTLQSLRLMDNQLDESAIQQIGILLPKLHGLRSLNIMANRFGEGGATALLTGLGTNVTLSKLAMPRGFLASDSIDYHVALNHAGRKLFTQHHYCPIPWSVWPRVLERINQLHHDDATTCVSILFHFLQQGPLLLIHELLHPKATGKNL